MLFGLITTTEDLKTQDKQRSSKWPAVRNAWIKTHPTCAACGGKDKLQVHHKLPFHLHPELELNPINLLTLCEGTRECHLRFGHFFNWQRYNPDVERMAREYLAGMAAAIARERI